MLAFIASRCKMSHLTQAGQSGGECEASGDSIIESYVLFPFSQNRCLTDVQIMDINGTDFNIERVKTLLLQSRNVPDIATYQMGFKNEESQKIIETEDSQIITEFINYLLNSNFTIVFLKTVSGKSK
uniref:Uncharacterized protein n=2 Tax=Biomphalaria glabrata TaxID=6526 RepID=A0A2C9M3Q2_BIOGL